MRRSLVALRACAALAVLASATLARPAAALDLAVTQFGIGMYGVPYAVAKDKGYFKEIGLDVTGFLTSAGGGTTVRNVLASELPYGEVSFPAALAAVEQGLPLTIVHGGVVSGADQLWVSRKDDGSIKGPADLKGKSLGYSGPNGVTDILSAVMVGRYGLTGEVARKAVGPVGAGLTALREKAVDIAYTFEPAWTRDKDKYRLAFSSSVFAPRVMQTVGIVRTDFLGKNGDLVRGIIAARRRGVRFIRQNPDEAAAIMAREYRIEVAVAREALGNILSSGGDYWSEGGFDRDGMEVILKGLELTGSLKTRPDLARIIDESFLPADLRMKPRS